MKDLDLYKKKFEVHTLRTKGCWIWQGRRTHEKDGKEKGVIRIGKKSRAATRVSWELFRGEIPEQMQIRQICKQDLCVNPNHLELIRHAYGRI
jgi:HNH endonuclease